MAYYPWVPAWNAPGQPWAVGGTTISLQRGTEELLRQVDILQTINREKEIEDDPYARNWVHWEAKGANRSERYVLIEHESGQPVALWLDRRRALRLRTGYAYRIDLVMVLPKYRGHGVGKLLVRLLLQRALALGAVRIVFHATTASFPFWVDCGATKCLDWKGSGFESRRPKLRLEIKTEALESATLGME